MCEFSERLIAWLDQELPAEQIATVAIHIHTCNECRSQIEEYRRVNEMIDSYCDAALACNPERRSNPRVWRPVFAAAAALAAAVLFLFLVRPVERLRSPVSTASDGVPAIALKTPVVLAPTVEKTSAAAIVGGTQLKRVNKPRLKHRPEALTVSTNRNNADWLPNEAPVYIAIPADALFPPGAFPEGVGFIADVNLRRDGSAQRLRLQPQLVGFQTRGTRP